MFEHKIKAIDIDKLVNSESCDLEVLKISESVESLVFLLEFLENDPSSNGESFSNDCLQQVVITEILLNMCDAKYRCNLNNIPKLKKARKFALLRVLQLCSFSVGEYQIPSTWLEKGRSIFEELEHRYLSLKDTGEYYIRS